MKLNDPIKDSNDNHDPQGKISSNNGKKDRSSVQKTQSDPKNTVNNDSKKVSSKTNGKTNEVKATTNSKSQKNNSLPQTGENRISGILSLIGAVILTTLGTVVAFRKKRSK